MARRILIVEDDKHFASQLSELMEFQGLEPVVRHSGPSGIEAFKQGAIDLIVLDVMLPDVHGIRVLEAIRTLPQGGDVPVLLMSAVYRSESLFRRDIARLGVSGFLSKPFSLLDLGRRIEGILASPDAGRAAVREALGSSAPPAKRPAPAAPTAREAPAATIPPAAAPALPSNEVSIIPADAGRRVPSSGSSSPEGYVRILATLFHAHSSGRLSLDGERGRRTIFLLNGYPVWVEADDPMNGLPRHLHQEGILSSEQLGRLRSWLATRRGSIRAALVELGLVAAMDLPALMDAWINAEVRDGLGDGGRFEFVPGDEFAGSRPVYEVNPIRAVCSGLAQHLSEDAARSTVAALSGRMLGRTKTFNRLFGYVGTTPELRELGEFLLRPRTVDELQARFGPGHPEVDRALWFLVHAGLVALSDSPKTTTRSPKTATRSPRANRRPREARSVPGAPVARPAHGTVPVELETRRIDRDMVARVVERARRHEGGAPPRPVADEDPATRIVSDYVTRIDLDHYSFLGVARSASAKQIDAAYQELAPRYRLRNMTVELQGDVRRQAKELLARLVQAFDELSTANRRAAYDATLPAAATAGSPSSLASPVAEPQNWVPGEDQPGFVSATRRRLGGLEADKFERAHRRMIDGEFSPAYAALEELRGRFPSDSALLASLGWCRHRLAPSDPRVLDKALEWVDLALAFRPDDRLALEVRARILAEAGDPRAEAAVIRLVRQAPSNTWARGLARSFDAKKEDTASTRTGVLRSLWGKRR